MAVATLKVDGLLFLLGAFAGISLFSETLPLFEDFWLHDGFLGRLTLPDLLGFSWTFTVLLVVIMALAVFRGVEILERHFAKEDEDDDE